MNEASLADGSELQPYENLRVLLIYLQVTVWNRAFMFAHLCR